MTVSPEELATAASQPGTFSFMDRLKGRNYPTETVTVYLDEAAGYAIRKLGSKLANETDADKVKALEIELVERVAEAKASAIDFKLRAISSEAYDKIIDEVDETIPTEYEETVSPLTGQKTKTPLPSQERETLFQSLLWSAFIEDIIEVATGASAGKPTPEDVVQYRLNLPLDGVRQIGITITALRMTVEWMDGIQDEGFFPTP